MGHQHQPVVADQPQHNRFRHLVELSLTHPEAYRISRDFR